MFADAGGELVEVVAYGGRAPLGAVVNPVAVVVGGVDGAVGEGACDAELLGKPVESVRCRGAVAFAGLLGGIGGGMKAPSNRRPWPMET